MLPPEIVSVLSFVVVDAIQDDGEYIKLGKIMFNPTSLE